VLLNTASESPIKRSPFTVTTVTRPSCVVLSSIALFAQSFSEEAGEIQQDHSLRRCRRPCRRDLEDHAAIRARSHGRQLHGGAGRLSSLWLRPPASPRRGSGAYSSSEKQSASRWSRVPSER